MENLVLKSEKGAALTHEEMDNNIKFLSTDGSVLEPLKKGWKYFAHTVLMEAGAEFDLKTVLPQNMLTFSIFTSYVCPHTGLGHGQDEWNWNYTPPMALLNGQSYSSSTATFSKNGLTDGHISGDVSVEFDTLIMTNYSPRSMEATVEVAYLERRELSDQFIYEQLIKNPLGRFANDAFAVLYSVVDGSYTFVSSIDKTMASFTHGAENYTILPNLDVVVTGETTPIFKITQAETMFEIIQLSDLSGNKVLNIITR